MIIHSPEIVLQNTNYLPIILTGDQLRREKIYSNDLKIVIPIMNHREEYSNSNSLILFSNITSAYQKTLKYQFPCKACYSFFIKLISIS